MQDLLKQIVDMDQEARRITEAAQQEKINSEKEIAAKREQIRQQYMMKARKRIEGNEPKERAAAEADWEIINKKNEEISKKLDALYAENGDRWVAEIVARVTGE